MTTLKFVGKVEFGDSCRSDPAEPEGYLHIGGRDVVAEVEEAKFRGPVTVGIANATFTGDLFVETGWGYSEFTPMEADRLRVGQHDLDDILGASGEDEDITLWISDEPIDLMAEGTA
jgi:hypothetical protein